MPRPTVARAHALLVITCPECGSTRIAHERVARAYRAGATTGRCRECARNPNAPPVTQSMVSWWRTQVRAGRYTMDEIREMAAALAPLLDEHTSYAKGRRKRKYDAAIKE